MAGISFDRRNSVGSKKCAIASPRIVSLEIGDESPGIASESVFQEIFLNNQASHNKVKDISNLICRCDKQGDKNLLIHSRSSLSTSTCDDRPLDKIKSTNDSDIDIDLLDLLNSADLGQAEKLDALNFKSKKATPNDKMKIISATEVNDGLSDLLTSIGHDISQKDEDVSTFKYCQRKSNEDCGIDLLDCDIAKNECLNSLSPNNSSLKAEGNLSDLLSSLNFEDSDVIKGGNFNSTSMCYSKVASKADLKEKSLVVDFSDLLSMDFKDSNDNKVVDSNCGNICKKEVSEVENEWCLTDVLSSIGIDKSASSILNNKPLSFDSPSLNFKNKNGESDVLNDFTFDIGSCSSLSNSGASSFNEKENNSPEDSFTKNNLTNKLFEFDSGYSSFDSAPKEFSFFDYSSDNQFSFNTLLTKKSNASVSIKYPNSENANEEMSMSDLMTIVSPEFKNPVLAPVSEPKSTGNKDELTMLDLMKCINIDDSHIINNSSVKCDEKMMNFDCVDGRISENVQRGMEMTDIHKDALSEKGNISIGRSDFVHDGDKDDDEQNTFIDLRECIKSAKHQFTPTSPIKQSLNTEKQSEECFSPNKIMFDCENITPSDLSQKRSNIFEFNNMVSLKKSKVNTRQTLFSKALACKPKKDHSLLQKVANIKNELLKNIVHRPVFIDCEVPQPIVESVLQSDRCIFRSEKPFFRSFGLDMPCELQ